MLTGLFAAAALASATTVKMLPGEHWWGVMNYYGTQMPFDERTDLRMDVRVSNESNQAASFLVSDRGRFIWCDEQTEVTIRDGAIAMRSAYPQKGYATVRDQFLMGERLLVRLPYFVREER